MRLKVKYLLFVLLIHATIAILAYRLLAERKILFLIVEIGIALSLMIAYSLYRSFINPLELMYTGVDAIKDKDFNVKFARSGSKELDKLIDVYNSMIDNIREERIQAKEQHFFLKNLIQALPIGILILDFDDNVDDINPMAKNILKSGKLEKAGLLSDFDHPLAAGIAGIEIGESKVLSVGSEQYKCEVTQFIYKGFPRKFIQIQSLSKEILAAEKRAYGKVIRMMAHEVNNSIGAINSILDSLRDVFSEQNEEEGIIESIEVAIDRNDRLNGFMRNFADVVRLPEPSFELLELNSLLSNMETLMTPQARKYNIDIHLKLPKATCRVSGDIRQLEQALVNIVKNAIESIEEDGIVELILEHPATIIVRDNGNGISTETSSKLFSPFFSTKVNGQGVGLTLVREILTNHNCQFSLATSEENGWTSFRIEFN